MKTLYKIVITLMLILFFVVAYNVVFASNAGKLSIVLEGESTVREPDDSIITHPANSRVDACAENRIVLEWVYDSSIVFIPRPCNRLFSDSFE